MCSTNLKCKQRNKFEMQRICQRAVSNFQFATAFHQNYCLCALQTQFCPLWIQFNWQITKKTQNVRITKHGWDALFVPLFILLAIFCLHNFRFIWLLFSFIWFILDNKGWFSGEHCTKYMWCLSVFADNWSNQWGISYENDPDSYFLPQILCFGSLPL